MLNESSKSLQSKSFQSPIKFSYRYLQALLGIEACPTRKTFRQRRDGQIRLANKLTKADLQLAITLQVGIQTDGISNFVNRHIVYLKLQEIFETPVTKDQFYAAFEKFEMHKLITVGNESHTGTMSLKLESYLESDGQLGRFFLLPNLVCSAAFGMLPIAAQKLYMYACGQQGDQRGKMLQLNYDKLGDLIRREEPSHIRRVLELLGTQPIVGSQPLFSVARSERNVFNQPKAVFQVNADLMPRHIQGIHYRSIFPAKKSYRQLIARLEGYLTAIGCESFTVWKNGQALLRLAALLKNKSETAIKYVMARIREFSLQGDYPETMLNDIRLEIVDKSTAALLNIAKDTGVIRYVQNRSEFVSKLKGLAKAGFRKLCKGALIELERNFARPAAYGSLDYRKPNLETEELESVIDLECYRAKAFRMERDPASFIDLVQDAYYKWLNGLSPSDVAHWIAWELDKLPQWTPIPDPPRHFCVATFLQQKTNI
ncbi:hypothetical protein ABEW34_21520 [Paenibacillus algorifonticola]|uniref:hypothetical protein n=1 Tax=Paenibacillus algorifonticola TaxID=684063 RepID=UPI003D27B138